MANVKYEELTNMKEYLANLANHPDDEEEFEEEEEEEPTNESSTTTCTCRLCEEMHQAIERFDKEASPSNLMQQLFYNAIIKAQEQ